MGKRALQRRPVLWRCSMKTSIAKLPMITITLVRGRSLIRACTVIGVSEDSFALTSVEESVARELSRFFAAFGFSSTLETSASPQFLNSPDTATSNPRCPTIISRTTRQPPRQCIHPPRLMPSTSAQSPTSSVSAVGLIPWRVSDEPGHNTFLLSCTSPLGLVRAPFST